MTALEGRLAEHAWYHTIEVAPGVVTPGYHDTRKLAPQLPWPDLSGLRCLDVGTFDGFWAYEMERRGASEVVAIDLIDAEAWDWPTGSEDQVKETIAQRKGAGSGFELVHEALGSAVVRHELSVYDAAPEQLGTFDFVYLGSLLLHLRDPVRAIEALRRVCTGTMMVVDAIDPKLTTRMRGTPAAVLDAAGRPWWWKPNVAGLERIVQAGGFQITEPGRRVWLPYGPGMKRPIITARRLLASNRREVLRAGLRGDPHAVLLARPR